LREQFAIWYPRSTDERARFVTDGLVALDTNALLHLYRLTPDVRNDLLALFARLGDRLWIPHQVGEEFHRNRLNVIHDQELAEQKLRTAVDDAMDRLDKAIKGLRDHPAIDRAELQATVTEGFAGIRTYLDKAISGSYLSVQAAMRSDEVLDSVTALFEGKVGVAYSDDRSREIESEARERFKQLIPPGYEDAKKSDNRDCGDYILWRQLLDEASKRKTPVLFVTNDQKEDWYRRVHGLTAGPRLELVKEMQREAGVDFHLQTLALFVDTAPVLLRSQLNEATVTEVSRLDELQQASSMADMASEIAVGSLTADLSGSTQQLGAATRRRGEDVDVHIARIQARRAELQRRLTELKSEYEIYKEGSVQRSDPRSITRAIEARIEATTNLLDEATRRLEDLHATRGDHVSDGGDGVRKELR
jgi:hypothetical protein